ncbi:MAG TPA: tetratricopeptide repeat protein [Bacteroidales bacterium]|nr:tetratricopeptide repeat protein [Bacteroidales bacterium]
MNNWDQENNEWQNTIILLVKRFNKMLATNANDFFDVEEFEIIIDYFLYNFNFTESEQAVQLALKQYPNSINILLKKAKLYAYLNKEKQALEILKNIENIEPENPEIFTAKGSIFSCLGHHDKAIKEYNKAIKIGKDVDVDDLHINIATEYNLMGNTNKAMQHLITALEINPENETAIFQIDFICNDTVSLYKAINFLSKFLDKHPFSPTAWHCLGNIYIKTGQFNEAIEAFDYAIAINPEYYIASYYSKAQAFEFLENYKDALITYKELLKLDKDNPYLYNSIGECYENLNQPKKSLSFFKKAITIEPYFAEAWINIGIFYINHDEPNVALKYMKKAYNIIPDDPYIINTIAEAYIALKKYKMAFKYYEKAIQIDPQNYNIWIDYADAMEEYKTTKEAIKILEKAIKINPNNSYLLYRMAACKITNGDNAEGMLTLFQAMKIDYYNLKMFFEYMPNMKNNKDILKLIKIMQNTYNKL